MLLNVCVRVVRARVSVSQPLCYCVPPYICMYVCMYVYAIYTRPLSAQAQYSRSCPIICCSCYNWLCPLLITSQHGLHRKQLFHCCNPAVALLRICCLATGVVLLFVSRECVYRAVSQKQPWYIRPFRSFCISMALYTTIFVTYYSSKTNYLLFLFLYFPRLNTLTSYYLEWILGSWIFKICSTTSWTSEQPTAWLL
jgi:hypothetical protein